MQEINYISIEKRADELVLIDDLISASFLYQKALYQAKKENSKREEIIRIKRKLISVNQMTVDLKGKYYKRNKVEIKLTEKDNSNINAYLSQILSIKKLSEILQIIGTSNLFIPKYEEIEKGAKANMPITRRLVSSSVVSNTGDLVRGGADGERSWIMLNYSLRLNLNMEFYLVKLFQELCRINKLNEKNSLVTLGNRAFFLAKK